MIIFRQPLTNEYCAINLTTGSHKQQHNYQSVLKLAPIIVSTDVNNKAKLPLLMETKGNVKDERVI